MAIPPAGAMEPEWLDTPTAGMSEADWLATPPAAKKVILDYQKLISANREKLKQLRLKHSITTEKRDRLLGENGLTSPKSS
jgi:hypothetical protein